MKSLRQILAGSFAVVLLATGIAGAAEPFYAGKTVTVIISGPPAGTSDLTCRILMQYLPDHIAGHPTMIGKNMDGAASIIAVNYMAREAKHDGSVMLCGVAAPANQLLKDPAFKADLTQFDFILGEGSPYLVYIRTDTAPGIKTPDDLFKAQGLVLGGSQVTSGHDIGERLYLDALGVKYRYVTGMPGDTGGRTAIQQKFINIFMESISGYTAVSEPAMGENGEILPLFQSGIPDAKGQLTVRDPREPNLPTFREFYQAKLGKPAAGVDVDLADKVVGIIATSLNVLALPPGAPKEASDALHASVDPLNQDPAYIAAAEKLRGPGARELPGSTVQALTDSYLHMSPELLDKFNDMIKSGDSLEKAK